MNRVNEGSLKEEHRKQVQNKAAGIDGVTKAEYGEKLDENVADLVARMKRFGYKPQPVRRIYIYRTYGSVRGSRQAFHATISRKECRDCLLD